MPEWKWPEGKMPEDDKELVRHIIQTPIKHLSIYFTQEKKHDEN